jgi:hypothetical protein
MLLFFLERITDMENIKKNKLKQLLATPIGAILLALSLIVTRFTPPTAFFDFLSGLLLGLSLAFNVYYIIAISKKHKD